ncbi:MAG TPA: hypothetical protein VGQ83_27035 [Polyangia bacterium]
MSIAFVNPPLRLLRDYIDYPHFGNLGLLQAAAVVRARGHAIVVRDAFAQSDSRLRVDGEGASVMGGAIDALIAPRANR